MGGVLLKLTDRRSPESRGNATVDSNYYFPVVRNADEAVNVIFEFNFLIVC